MLNKLCRWSGMFVIAIFQLAYMYLIVAVVQLDNLILEMANCRLFFCEALALRTQSIETLGHFYVFQSHVPS